jgi:hypothetical protein
MIHSATVHLRLLWIRGMSLTQFVWFVCFCFSAGLGLQGWLHHRANPDALWDPLLIYGVIAAEIAMVAALGGWSWHRWGMAKKLDGDPPEVVVCGREDESV